MKEWGGTNEDVEIRGNETETKGNGEKEQRMLEDT